MIQFESRLLQKMQCVEDIIDFVPTLNLSLINAKQNHVKLNSSPDVSVY